MAEEWRCLIRDVSMTIAVLVRASDGRARFGMALRVGAWPQPRRFVYSALLGEICSVSFSLSWIAKKARQAPGTRIYKKTPWPNQSEFAVRWRRGIKLRLCLSALERILYTNSKFYKTNMKEKYRLIISFLSVSPIYIYLLLGNAYKLRVEKLHSLKITYLTSNDSVFVTSK